MARTKTIVNKISERTKPKRFKKIVEFEQSYNRNAAVLTDATANFDDRLQVLNKLASKLMEATGELETVKNQYESISGHVLEGSDVLRAIVDQLAQDHTLTTNLIEVFFRSDPKILVQVIEVMDTEIRQKAWQNLDPVLREMIRAELEQVR